MPRFENSVLDTGLSIFHSFILEEIEIDRARLGYAKRCSHWISHGLSRARSVLESDGRLSIWTDVNRSMNRTTRLQREALGVFPGVRAKYASQDLRSDILGSQSLKDQWKPFCSVKTPDHAAITGVISITLRTPDLQNRMTSPLTPSWAF